MKGKLGLTAVVIGIAIAVALVWRSRSGDSAADTRPDLLAPPHKPRKPPEHPNTNPTPMPERPKLPPTFFDDKYREAVARGDKRPGAAAFRAGTDAFFDYNIEFGKAQAAKERLSLEEVKELTYFGFLVMQSQRTDAIEETLGRDLTEEQNALLQNLQMDRNVDFKDTIRQMVADGAAEPARWAYIDQTRDQYMTEYLAITGMTEEQFDMMLAGGAAMPPDELPPPRPYTEDKARPGAPQR